MFSNSNSFLGAGNSGRPVPPQYGQQSFSNPPQGQQQAGGFAPQTTGFGGSSIQPQYSGYPTQQQNFQAPQPQQPQYTGYPAQPQNSFQNPPPLQQPFPTGQPLPTQAQPQRPGLTSSQIAQSFQSVPAAQAVTSKTSKANAKIPSIRLSFITASDQAKFEQLFKSAVGDGQALDGMGASEVWLWKMLIFK